MYATCLHCHRALGRNDAIETFPIGRRLAFDAAKGRLWVICPACQRWNLTPIEERWEAVESCERLFRGQRLRSQTDNIGSTRISEGTELIRVGRPLRPEFAAWRYGAVLGGRLRKRAAAVAGTGVAIAGGGLLIAGSPALAIGATLAALSLLGYGIEPRTEMRRTVVGKKIIDVVGIKVVGEDGRPLGVTRTNLEHISISPNDGPIQLNLHHSYGTQLLTGDRATRALSTILARVNRAGASRAQITAAAGAIADAGDPRRAIAAVARESERRRGDFEERVAEFRRGPRGRTIGEVLAEQDRIQRRSGGLKVQGFEPRNKGALMRLPAAHRLALEMALHETSEQHALDGELADLERAWREAEEIAAIADSLLTPEQSKIY